MILLGELPPGERLREVALSEALGMSRTPIREAFRTLAAEGLIDLLPNRSIVVGVRRVGSRRRLYRAGRARKAWPGWANQGSLATQPSSVGLRLRHEHPGRRPGVRPVLTSPLRQRVQLNGPAFASTRLRFRLPVSS